MQAAKEQAEQDKERQLEMLKEKLETETVRTNERMRDTLRKQEEEITKLRKERKEQDMRSTEVISLMEKQDRSLLDDINEECRRIAALIGTQPRVVSNPT